MIWAISVLAERLLSSPAFLDHARLLPASLVETAKTCGQDCITVTTDFLSQGTALPDFTNPGWSAYL